ncbi:MAG: indole-3-glycerol phosphate synthase TrpC [Candidatus Caldatribacterium sp.]|uniref:indole-3-glycerol phosphate synthase TrpC n=1 Tax=Candidatus Caldatribacterium sp. TaxID=2282143 RepID=UPI00299451B1|nr:indole-3-glycerol phosphate synthase TrpC [Candidatus Caldatribacterium sp.]MCX7730423.1 indole-3-glycerol phosphate synthase TrpC [Candidatus Caldatribacterium sp.]MDW8080541.1 indole-3-glycerol phosphate synthase TrpC [Candidatus Calescibacterium sp.]
MENILEALVTAKKRRLFAQERWYSPIDVARLLASPQKGTFLAALRGSGPNIIAEIKLASPSRGRFIAPQDVPYFLSSYEEGGAKAISVVTEEEHFQGSSALLREVVQKTSLPVLRKDFVLEETQIYETKEAGAHAILLIARIVSGDRLKHFVRLAELLGLTPVVEVHDAEDLKKALFAQAQVIGINNRDLSTFQVSLETTLRLLPLVPAGVTVITESGIATREDVELLLEVGVRNFLVGGSLLTARDPVKKLRELQGEETVARC